jgi:putative heme-binding domain-containing protein
MRGALGIVVSEKSDRHGKGVFVASKGKVSFFPDANGDDRADEEKVIASGWKETFHGVDTLGLARDPKDGSLYFGLGCTNFADAYLIDRNTGKSQYDVRGIRGTIQRLTADFSQQETICTGVRFTCALAFNRAGDLFASEQEGATWLPNGNPFDELLHIERGKHYGFPPRHPKHLVGVMDEPAVMEYGPQHQSTVGMVFNEGVNGGPSFGPKFWEGDVIMCGESRGKLWRTKLVKTPLGYVAQNHLLACLGMLLVDACVTPQGDLLLACHSGPPDWGTGPAGEGRLFKIRYQRKELPQPVIAWASAPDEFRIAFNKKLEPSDWTDALKKTRIEAGRFVSAGDRYETVRPGYQVVRDQMGAPRRWVEVLGLSMSQDQRTLILRVPRQTEPVGYAVTLPLPDRWIRTGGIEQKAEMDVALAMNGTLAQVKTGAGEVTACVLPHPAPWVSRELCDGSADHETFFQKASTGGAALSLEALVDSSNPFVPAVQPGSKLDWDVSGDPFVKAIFDVKSSGRSDEVHVTHQVSQGGRLKPLAITMATGPSTSTADVFIEGAGAQRPLSTPRVFVPWTTESAKPAAAGTSQPLATARTDVKGNWMEGRRLFFGQAACFTCHTLRGEGLAFGPDLTNLIHRDRASVLQDILHPSATINPDQFGSIVKMKDGTSLAGIVRAGAGATVKIGLPGGALMEMAREKVAAIEPMKISLMPEDFAKRLSASQQEDLLTFLLTAPLEPAAITRVDPPAPAPRSLKEIASILPPVPSLESRAAWKPLRILLVIDSKDHGIDEHDYPLWLDRWTRLLSLAENVQVDTCEGFPSAEQLSKADVTVLYSRNSKWDLRTAKLLDDYQERGGGLVYLHWAIEGGKHAMPLAERVGLAFSFSKFRHGDMDLEFTAPNHPITRGLQKLKLTDESYWNLRGEPNRVSLLATSQEDQAPQPQLWTLERGKGRVFGCIPGHYTWTFDDPLYRLMVLRGICWAAKQEDVERLSELSLIGARVQP